MTIIFALELFVEPGEQLSHIQKCDDKPFSYWFKLGNKFIIIEFDKCVWFYYVYGEESKGILPVGNTYHPVCLYLAETKRLSIRFDRNTN